MIDGDLEEFEKLFTVTLPQQPYPGLRPFEKDEWPIFFGRERMADAVVAQVIAKRMLVVHGDSGCGKSSLVRAAVLPRLEQESARGGVRWRTCAATPGEAPLWNLARSLATQTAQSASEETAIEMRRALNFGRSAPARLSELLRRDAKDQICILIDQFEELFTYSAAHGPEEGRLLTDFLSALYNEPTEGFYAIITMRSEFLGVCARFGDFAETVNATQYLLPRMRHDDLLRAIREPAALYEGEVTRELAERLIADAGGGQDQLPLIQHGLMLLYGQHVRPAAPWRLGIELYRSDTGLKGLLSDHADAVMLEAERRTGRADADARVVEDLFRALTDINAEGQAIRRPRSFSDLVKVTGATESVLRQVIDAFRAEGVSFLRPYGTGPLDRESLIDISHEALIRCWQKIAEPKDGWLIREFRNGLVWRALLVQAESFERDPTNVLAAATTDEREKWMRRRNREWAERYGGGWDRVQKLLAASADARDRERSKQAEERRREQKDKLREQKFRMIRFGSVLLGLLLIAAVYFALRSRTQARQAREALAKAETALNEARTQSLTVDAVRQTSEALEARSANSADKLLAVAAGLSTGANQTSRNEAREQLRRLANELKNVNQVKPTVPAVTGPRVYIHIIDENDRTAATAFERQLEATLVDGSRIVVPGIELVKASVPRSVLRCFRAQECKDEAARLLEAVNRLRARPIQMQDMSDVYGTATNIRPRHYELWFTRGDVTLK
jgi:hypothetical protein